MTAAARGFVAIALVTTFSSATRPAQAATPWTPLSVAELKVASGAIKRDPRFPADGQFVLLTLAEPPKGAATDRTPPPRRAQAIIYSKRENALTEIEVELGKKAVVSLRKLAGQPPMLASEYEDVPAVVMKDPRFVEALKRRGITRLDDVHLDAWLPSLSPGAGNESIRVFRVIPFLRQGAAHPYDRPIEGLQLVVDATNGRVLSVLDKKQVPIGKSYADVLPAEALDKKVVKRRKPPAGLVVRGNQVSWHSWRLQVSMHPREGMVLHRVGWQQGTAPVRSILHRAGLAEMVVPYGDPDPDWSWRAAFDEGEYGIGWSVDRLVPGVHVPADAALIDALFATAAGEPEPRKSVIAVYERDGGVLWKHRDYYSQKSAVRRGRELVVESTCFIGNYDYSFRWVFDEVGTIQVEVELNGMVLPRGTDQASCESCASDGGKSARAIGSGDQRYGTLIAPNIIGVNHQHFFNFRLDFDIDGSGNSVREVNATAEPTSAKGNAMRNAFFREETLLASEKGAVRDLAPERDRCWKIFNPNVPGKLGHFPAYVLMPSANTGPMAAAGSQVRARAAFVEHPFWVTRYDPAEMYAAGDYPTLRATPDGLSVWTQKDRKLVDSDVVVWYTVGVTHLPKPEDWPIMTAVRAGFRLVPKGFFDGNPLLIKP